MLDNDLVKGTDAYQKDNIVYLDPFAWYVAGGGLTSVSSMIDEISKGIE